MNMMKKKKRGQNVCEGGSVLQDRKPVRTSAEVKEQRCKKTCAGERKCKKNEKKEDVSDRQKKERRKK